MGEGREREWECKHIYLFPHLEGHAALLYTIQDSILHSRCRQMSHWSLWETCLQEDCRIKKSMITELQTVGIHISHCLYQQSSGDLESALHLEEYKIQVQKTPVWILTSSCLNHKPPNPLNLPNLSRYLWGSQTAQSLETRTNKWIQFNSLNNSTQILLSLQFKLKLLKMNRYGFCFWRFRVFPPDFHS